MKISNKWKNRITVIDSKNCKPCEDNHGRIYGIAEKVTPSPPLHPHCRCTIQILKSLFAGEATDKGGDGADWHLKYNGKLPDYYISRSEANKLGWDRKRKKLSDIAPGFMLYGGIHKNTEGKLPSKPGRIWYEADIEYTLGGRNTKRIVFSNDGLIFITYDHYRTFMEIR